MNIIWDIFHIFPENSISAAIFQSETNRKDSLSGKAYDNTVH